MAAAKNGDTVKVHYTGTLDDGSKFDSSEGREPLEFTVNANQVIPGFDEAVVGMEPGHKKSIKIQSDQAYGPHREEMVVEVPRDMFPSEMELNEGQMIRVPTESGGMMPVTVVELKEEHVTLDANHRLAGKDLTFEIEMVEVNKAG